MDAVETVRAFNRAVTQRIGALDDRFLARGRPLGEARVLWEIGPEGCEVRQIRSRLGLDSGYVSRLLRSLEGAGLIAVEPGGHDRRVRTVHLTRTGRKELATLDRRSDAFARSILDALSHDQQERLVAAMEEVRRLLAATQIEIAPADPAGPEAGHCLTEYFCELGRRFPGGFDLGASRLPDPAEMRPPGGEFLIVTLSGEPIGCGGLKFHDDDVDRTTEVKRMWVDPSVRGLGIGRRLLAALEQRAVEHGTRTIRLDTNGSLSEAIAMYRSAGYRQVAAFNDEVHADHWFEKEITSGPTTRRPRRPR